MAAVYGTNTEDVAKSRIGNEAYMKEWGTGPRAGESQAQAQSRASEARARAIGQYGAPAAPAASASAAKPAVKAEKSKPVKMEGLAKKKKPKPDATADMGLKKKFQERRKGKASPATTVY